MPESPLSQGGSGLFYWKGAKASQAHQKPTGFLSHSFPLGISSPLTLMEQRLGDQTFLRHVSGPANPPS
jgi:hypothetical protein